MSTTESTCKACRAFDKNFHHYISYDSGNLINETSSSNNICFVSQSTPSDSEVFALVRKACLRTLHCEVFEDPIYFDDDKNGSVIGYEFHIKDSEGRGQQRAYSLIIIMKDRIYLQHLWSFLSQQMAIIASNIKEEAQRKFEREMRENPVTNGLLLLQGSRASVHSLKKKDRGLIELTDDPMIFAKLHMWFTWILRMSACQISEEFIHGPLSEDIQVRLEKEEVFSNTQSQNPININNHLSLMNKSFSNCSIGEVSIENFSADLEGCLSLESKSYLPFSSEDDSERLLSSFQVDNLRQLVKVGLVFSKNNTDNVDLFVGLNQFID